MPAHEPQIAPTRAASIVKHLCLGAREGPLSCQPKPHAEVDILVIQEKCLVEPSNGGETFGAKEHEHPTHPIRDECFIAQPEGITAIT